MTHRECRDLFVAALYDELQGPQGREFEEHVADCSECRAELGQLRLVASTMNQRVRPEPSDVDWKIFWNELSAEISHPINRPGRSFMRLDRLAAFFRFRPLLSYGTAAVMILAIGIFIGRLLLVGNPDLDTQRLSERLSEAERTILNERTQNYLQRSKILLLGIVNGSGVTPSSYETSKQQEVSRMLVKEAGPLQSRLTEADQQQMKKLIGDLQVILLQLANLEESKDFPALEIVRDGVERNGILLKINLEQMNAQESAPQPATKNGSKSSSI